MATKTFHIIGDAAVSPGWFGNLQDGGSAPGAALSAYGWTVAKTAVTTPYWRGRLGATARSTVAQAASWIDSNNPTAGSGSGNTTAGDCFISPTKYFGDFAAGNWPFIFGMRTGAATVVGRIRCRVYASVNANGSSARLLSSSTLVGTPVTMNSTSATFSSTVTWSAPAITLVGEYLLFQVEWQETTAGTSNSCSAQFYQSACTITTTDFVPAKLTKVKHAGVWKLPTAIYAKNAGTWKTATMFVKDGGVWKQV